VTEQIKDLIVIEHLAREPSSTKLTFEQYVEAQNNRFRHLN